MAKLTTSKPETGRFRATVDRGGTHDKVAFPDPATVPLQTDAESGGQPTPAAALAAVARDQSRQRISETPAANETVAGRAQHQIPARAQARWLGAAFAIMVLLGLGAAFMTLP